MIKPATLCLFAAALLPFARLWAGELELEHYQAKRLVASGKIISLEASLPEVNRLCPGVLMDAHLYQKNSQWRYELQIKTPNGAIIELNLDATTGQLIPQTNLPSECLNNETLAG